MTKASVEHASFTIERVFKASPARVFQAFADPAAHDRWFVKADNWPVAEYSHDFRVGGRDGKTFYFNETVYLDIVENRRIISAYRWRRTTGGFPPRSPRSTSFRKAPARASSSPNRRPFWTASTRSNIAATAGSS